MPGEIMRRQCRHGAPSLATSVCAGKPYWGSFFDFRTLSAISVGTATTRIGIIFLSLLSIKVKPFSSAHGLSFSDVARRGYPLLAFKLEDLLAGENRSTVRASR
jgi:hypothetical protein